MAKIQNSWRVGSKADQKRISGLWTVQEKIQALKNRTPSSSLNQQMAKFSKWKKVNAAGEELSAPSPERVNSFNKQFSTTSSPDISKSVVEGRLKWQLWTTREELKSRKELLDRWYSINQIDQFQWIWAGKAVTTESTSQPWTTWEVPTDSWAPEVVSSSPLARWLWAEPGSAEERLAASAEAQTQAQQQLLSFLSKPQQSLVEQFKELREASGRSWLISGRQSTLEEINRIKWGVEAVRANLREQGWAITTAAAARQEGRHLEQVRPELTRLQWQLEIQSSEIKEMDSTINQLLQFWQTDRAAEIKRLATLASTWAISTSEKELLTAKIKAEATAAKDELKTIQDSRKTLDAWIKTIRDFATREWVISSAFNDTVTEALRRLATGEDAQTILADVSAAVNNNPVLKRKLEAEVKRKEQLAAKGSWSGSWSWVTRTYTQKEVWPTPEWTKPKEYKITEKNWKIIRIDERTEASKAYDSLFGW
jgi:hypothetical protein